VLELYVLMAVLLAPLLAAPSPPPCSASATEFCPSSKLKPMTATCADAISTGALRIGTAPLPRNLQGVFWLTEQGGSSALMSFAQSNDGGGFSTGSLQLQGRRRRSHAEYSIRVAGDRVWSFSDGPEGAFETVHNIDLVYRFEFDDLTRPQSAQIFPSSNHERATGFEPAPWMLSFDMRLQPLGSHSRYPSSIVWVRPSSVLHINIRSAYYDLVQVVDGDGRYLQPAWSDYVAFCSGSSAGDSPGKVFYRAAEPLPAPPPPPPPPPPESWRPRWRSAAPILTSSVNSEGPEEKENQMGPSRVKMGHSSWHRTHSSRACPTHPDPKEAVMCRT